MDIRIGPLKRSGPNSPLVRRISVPGFMNDNPHPIYGLSGELNVDTDLCGIIRVMSDQIHDVDERFQKAVQFLT